MARTELMFVLRFRSNLSSSSHLLKLDRSFIYPFTLPQIHTTEISRPKKSLKNPILYNYLIDAFNFPHEKAIKVSNRFRCINNLEQPQSVVHFLKSFGFSDYQICSAVNTWPHLLYANPEKTLGPKLWYFQELGFSCSDLGKFIAKNSSVLTRSLEDTLKPCIANIKKIIGNDENNKDLIRHLSRCYWVTARTPNARLMSNVLYVKSCGIDDNQLSKLFKRHPRIFTMSKSELRGIVENISEWGFPMDSRMLIHAIFSVGFLRTETLERKLDLIRSFGFSNDECPEMFRRPPYFLRISEVKLRFAMNFLLDQLSYRNRL